jgi:phage terminase large subunit-like protein
MNSAEILLDRWTQLSPGEQREVLAAQRPNNLRRWHGDWGLHAHPHQRPPDGDWTVWLLLGGRGAGKTRAGAEWVRAITQEEAPQARRIALIGETEHDVREVMIEGVSGLLALYPRGDGPNWVSSRRRLEWPNGAVAQAFSAEDPESLRGPQFDAAWLDELAKWRHAEATFDMLQFGLRLGARPRQVITTTPRPLPLLKRLRQEAGTVVTHARTQDNARHLSPVFVDTVLKRYVGTRLGRQEIDGEIVEERSDALWSRDLIERCRVAAAPQLARIVVAVDPPASASKGADACGLVAAGRAEDGRIYVLADETVSGLSPAGWARKAVVLWRRLNADALVAEVNQGGDMVRAVIGEADREVPVQPVRARRGKWLRAEPVAALYEQGRVKHVGGFAALEDELCDFGLDGLSSGRSPDRLDALVWAVAALSFGTRDAPRVRML